MDLVRKLYLSFKKSQDYKDYIAATSLSPKEELEFISKLVKKFILGSEVLEHFLEEKSVYWVDHFDFTCRMMIKTFQAASDNSITLFPLYKDFEEDVDFVKILFRKTIVNDEKFSVLIGDKTQNWEIERIALIDIILLKMSLSEILSFPMIPVKVSINEYIEISKEYSSPKSKQFINGVLDKIVIDLKAGGEITKLGRGLIE